MQEVLLKSAVYSCAFQLIAQPWIYDNHERFFGSICNYEPAKGSWVVCIHDDLLDLVNVTALRSQQYNDYLDKIAQDMNHACRAETCKPMNRDVFTRIWQNATGYIQPPPEDHDDCINNNIEWHRKLPQLAKSELTKRALPSLYHREPTLFYPIRVPPTKRLQSLQSLGVYYRNIVASNWATIYLFIYLGLIVLIGTLFAIKPVRCYILRAPFITYIRSRWTLPAVSEKHAQDSSALQGLIPTRLEVCLIGGYLLVHLFAAVSNYTPVIETADEQEPVYLQQLRYFSDRLGILCFAQLPLIILFAGRNSFVENLSGLRYTTSIVLHKWISRVMVTDAFVHGAIYAMRAERSGTIKQIEKEQFWVFGIGAMWAGIFLVVTSIGWIRRKFYETFLIVHILLAIVFFRCLWIHVRIFGWTEWIWWSVGLWIAEKVARIIRITRMGGIITARAQIFGTDVVRLTIPKPLGAKSWQPGQYGFLYILRPSVFWQSHPFTVMDTGANLVIVMKAKTGATAKLLQYIKSQGHVEEALVKVMIEGPYGESCALPHYDSQLLLSGGSGIPGPLSYVLQYNLEKTVCVIACRDHVFLQAFQPELKRALTSTNVKMHIYITGSQLSDYGSINSSVVDMPISKGRPDLNEIIADIALHDGSLAVMTCGPPVFVDKIRGIVANHLWNYRWKSIELIEEYQIW